MDDASDGMDKKTFKKPSSAVRAGKTVKVPSVQGRTLSQARSILADAGFDAHVIEVTNTAAKGTVLGTQPSGRAPWGSSIGVLVSSGYVAPPPDDEESEDEDKEDKDKSDDTAKEKPKPKDRDKKDD